MKIFRAPLFWFILGAVLFVVAQAFGGDFHPLAPRQITSKVLGTTTIEQCPSADVVARIIESGETLGADYTEILPVLGQDKCPNTKPLNVHVHYEDGIGPNVLRNGVTFGVHYKISE